MEVRDDMNKEYSQIMTQVYEKAYGSAYKYELKSLQISNQIIQKDIAFIKKNGKYISEINSALNIGTGREAINLLNYAQNVYHCDISKFAVCSLKKYINEHGISSLSTAEVDICAIDSNLVRKLNLGTMNVDLIYLNGIIQHLYNVNRAIENLDSILKIDGILFIRTYRKHHLLFEYAKVIRSLNLNLEVVEKSRSFIERDLYADFIDDVFVPTLLIYDPKDIISAFSNYGYKLLISGNVRNMKDYSFENEIIGFDESIEFVFKKESNIKKEHFRLSGDRANNLCHTLPILSNVVEYISFLNIEFYQNHISSEYYVKTILKTYEMVHPRNSQNKTMKQCIEEIESFLLNRIDCFNR